MEIKAIKTRVFDEQTNLSQFIFKYVRKIADRSILVVTSKIVALSEGRTVEYKNEKQKVALIKKESDFALKTKNTWFTIKDGMALASAGIDESNAKSKLILLPRDSFKTAGFLRKKIMQKFQLKNFGVLITDSALIPLRAGVLGVALGYAGFEGIKSYKNKKDIFGRKFLYQKTNVADSLATSATLCMGEGPEQKPLALIHNAPVVFTKKLNKQELKINPTEDIFYPLLKYVKNKKTKQKIQKD